METLTEAFLSDSGLGLGVIFGEISGGLASRDFDVMESYEAWAREYSDFATTLPTVETSRGMHVYCRTSPENVAAARRSLRKEQGSGAICLGDGELRCGAGCYSVLPPSIHPSGHEYAWHVQPIWNAQFPEVDLLDAGLTTCFTDSTQGHTREHRGTQETQDTQGTQEAQEIIGSSELNAYVWDEKSIRVAVDATIPTKEGTRHHQVFELARTLKGFFPDSNPLDMEKWVRYWHGKALPYITTTEYEDSWFEFLTAWDEVKYPMGAGAMTAVMQRAAAREIPKCAKQFENPKLKLLIAICRELHQKSQGEPFFLSCRMAASLIDVKYTKANQWLRVLPIFGILELVNKGQLKGRKASEYLYIGD